ncbi:uncharacterized protein LOC108907087 [Anoplophora glabripennis]|uniref:uncharacterized protein LOC108907087 n=1 Tax=Anoplophora glabripennis TaxID=217634 RepID=UPI00087487A1|nr:uncharacterized protein LOC108907087 [Anoplophora glabripennis]
MFRFNYLLLISAILTYSVSVSIPTPPVDDDPTAEWDKNKLEILNDLVGALLKYTGHGVTVVASQNIHNADGSFKEIKTIELTIPSVYHRGSSSNNEYTDSLEKLKQNDDELGDTIKKMQTDYKRAFESGHYDKEAAYLKQVDGEAELEIYVGKNEVFYQDDEGMGYYLRDNIIGTDKKKLEEEFKKRFEDRSNNTLISVLVWDADKKFVSEESRVEPKLLVYVDKASDNVDEKMMDSAMEGLAKYVLNYPDRVAKELSAAMSNAHPDYVWLVTKWQDEQADNAKHDVYIKLTYDNVEVGDYPIEYTVFGVKK